MRPRSAPDLAILRPRPRVTLLFNARLPFSWSSRGLSIPHGCPEDTRRESGAMAAGEVARCSRTSEQRSGIALGDRHAVGLLQGRLLELQRGGLEAIERGVRAARMRPEPTAATARSTTEIPFEHCRIDPDPPRPEQSLDRARSRAGASR